MANTRKKMVLCDTNIFIKIFRGDDDVSEKFKKLTDEREERWKKFEKLSDR